MSSLPSDANTVNTFSRINTRGVIMKGMIAWIYSFFRNPLTEFIEFHNAFSCSSAGLNSPEERARIELWLNESRALEARLKIQLQYPYTPECEAAFALMSLKRKWAEDFLATQAFLDERSSMHNLLMVLNDR